MYFEFKKLNSALGMHSIGWLLIPVYAHTFYTHMQITSSPLDFNILLRFFIVIMKALRQLQDTKLFKCSQIRKPHQLVCKTCHIHYKHYCWQTMLIFYFKTFIVLIFLLLLFKVFPVIPNCRNTVNPETKISQYMYMWLKQWNLHLHLVFVV